MVALVEEKQLDRARECAAMIDQARIEVVPGDITEPGLGLQEMRREQLQQEVLQVFHLAAIYNLAVPLELAERVNIDGTGNMLDFCAGCRQLERLNYVSTAYVAGDRHGLGLRARAGGRPGVQEPLRVDQVPGRAVGP